MHQPYTRLTQQKLSSTISLSLPDNFVFKLFRLSPLPQTAQTKTVITIGHDPKSGLRLGHLVHHDLHANTTSFVPSFGHRKGLFHFGLMGLHADFLMISPLIFMGRMEHRLVTHITNKAVLIGTIFTVAAFFHHAKWAELRFGLVYRDLGHGLGVDYLGP